MSCSVNLKVVATSLRDPLAHFLEVSSKSHRLAKFALPLKTSIICGSSGWFRKENEALLSAIVMVLFKSLAAARLRIGCEQGGIGVSVMGC